MTLVRAPLGASLTPIKNAIRPDRRTRLTLILTSGLINLLTLTGSLFMMQVYDRVLGSQSISTLIGLSAIALFAYGLQGVLETMRTRIFVLISERFDAEIGPKVAAANLAKAEGELVVQQRQATKIQLDYQKQAEKLTGLLKDFQL